MTAVEILLPLILAVVAAECSSLLHRVAQYLIRWAVWLSYGHSPRAEIRLREQVDNLTDCPGQITKLLYAFSWTLRGIGEWLWRMSGRSGTPGWETAGPSQVFGAVMALNNVVEGFGGDIRAQSPARRTQFDSAAARLRRVLGQPAVALDEQCAALSASATARVCQMYVDDRNESATLSLIEAASPLMGRLGRHHQAVLALRRVHAAALLALGRHQRAEELLRGLTDDEAQVFGAENPRTAPTEQLLCWALEKAGRSEEAEAGLRALKARLAHRPDADRALLRHIECKLSWTVGRQRRTRESAHDYEGVIANRSRELSPDHADTLDARHSKAKMYVHNGDGPAAYAPLKALLPDMRRVLGARHPYTLEARKYLALARDLMHPHSAHEHRQVLRELRRIRRLQTRRHGPDYPDARDTQQWLATSGWEKP